MNLESEPNYTPPLPILPTGWTGPVRAGIPVHPVADQFPMMDSEKIALQAESIRVNGLYDRVEYWIDPNSQPWFIDGRNRDESMDMIGMDTREHMVEVKGTPEGIVERIVTRNLQRRHLTVSEKSILAGRLVLAMRHDAKGPALGRPKPEPEEQQTFHNQLPEEPATSAWVPEGVRPRNYMAAQFGVSGSSVQHGMTCLRDEEITARVEAGDIAVSRGAAKVLAKEREIAAANEEDPSGKQASLISTEPSAKKHPDYDRKNEAYTPEREIRAGELVVGGRFDLDVASCPEANEVVKASKIFTIWDDGLSQTWFGKVWCNAPYTGKQNMNLWSKAFREKYEAFEFEEGFFVCNADPSTSWFQSLYQFHVCFPSSRLRFTGPGGGKTPEKPQAIFYAGPNGSRFMAVFERIGRVVKPYSKSRIRAMGSELPTENVLVPLAPPRVKPDKIAS